MRRLLLACLIAGLTVAALLLCTRFLRSSQPDRLVMRGP